ncbi:MAG: endonuclease III [Myxococcota bacterium]
MIKRGAPAPSPAKAGPAKTAANRGAPTATARSKVAPKPAKGKKPATVSQSVALREFEALREQHPDAHCELDHQNPFQLLVATVLSAQTTDVMVNKLTPELFQRWPTAEALAKADPAAVELHLSKMGMFRQKTKNIIGLSKMLVEHHDGEVPRSLAELIKLPGVGRKTANVVLGVAFGKPEGVVVDTHVQRLSQRLGFTKHQEPLEIEQDLMRIFPESDWDPLSHVLIFHGRRVCSARKPACAACSAQKDCPSAFRAENVGRKAPRLRS